MPVLLQKKRKKSNSQRVGCVIGEVVVVIALGDEWTLKVSFKHVGWGSRKNSMSL